MVEKAFVFLNLIPTAHLLRHINQIKIVSVPKGERRIRLIEIAHRGGHKIRAKGGANPAKSEEIRGRASTGRIKTFGQIVASQTKNTVKGNFFGYAPGRF